MRRAASSLRRLPDCRSLIGIPRPSSFTTPRTDSTGTDGSSRKIGFGERWKSTANGCPKHILSSPGTGVTLLSNGLTASGREAVLHLRRYATELSSPESIAACMKKDAPLAPARANRAPDSCRRPHQGRRARCQCGQCRQCTEDARWERIFAAKFADPDYYTRPSVQYQSPLMSL